MLRPDLVVKAYYDGGVVETVTNYTLSGTLEVGTSTITASYKGKSDSFDVTVVSSIVYLYKWDLTQSLTDEIQGVVAYAQGSNFESGVGVTFNSANASLWLTNNTHIYIELNGKTIEIDFSNMQKAFGNSSHGRLITKDESNGFIYRHQTQQWECYSNGWKTYVNTSSDANAFNGKTAKFIINDINTDIEVYADNNLIYKGSGWSNNDNVSLHLSTYYNHVGNGYYNMTITGVRIYETPTGGN